jgi:hypothetical protein
MTRTQARVTQADVARCVRAAMQAGAGGVEVRRDGSDEYLAGIMAKIAPTFSAADKRAAVERELVYRRRVFKRLVDAGKMKQSAMDTQIAIFEAIRDDYSAIEATERLV